MGDSDYGDIWRSALNANILCLQQNLLLNDTFYGYLIQKKVFTQDTIEEFKREKSSDARILTLVGYLKRRNDQCFENFLSILESTDNRFLREMIEQSLRNNRLRRQTDEDSKPSDALKERHIVELEQEVSDLTKKCAEAENVAKMEMERSKYYLEVIQSLTAVRSVLTNNNALEDRESELEEMAEEIDSLKDQTEALEKRLRQTTQDLEKTRRELNKVIEAEKKFKQNLGLQEDADELEVTARIQEMKRSQAELKTMQNEMDRINEMKDAYAEKIRKLTQDVKRVDADRRRKDLQMQRMIRNKEDSHILQNARAILSENKPNTSHPIDHRVLEKMSLPRIDIGFRLPSTKDFNANRKISSARDPTVPHQPQFFQQNSIVRAITCLPSNEPMYCVLCRHEFHVGEACRIHPAAKRDGRYLCCNAAENGVRAIGCRTLNSHLRIQFTGVAKDCNFCDQHGKLLCFKDSDAEGERLASLSGR